MNGFSINKDLRLTLKTLADPHATWGCWVIGTHRRTRKLCQQLSNRGLAEWDGAGRCRATDAGHKIAAGLKALEVFERANRS